MPARPCAAQVLLICHWFTCLLGMLSMLSSSPLSSWQAKYGLCTPVTPPAACPDELTYECVDPGEAYVKTFYWALGLITGFSSLPSQGPYSPHYADGTKRHLTIGEDVAVIVIALVSSATWAYVTGKVVDLIANGDPDTTAFQKQMDELNRFVRAAPPAPPAPAQAAAKAAAQPPAHALATRCAPAACHAVRALWRHDLRAAASASVATLCKAPSPASRRYPCDLVTMPCACTCAANGNR
jgi:hypothetical protein